MKAELLTEQLSFRATKSEKDRIEAIATKEERRVADVIRRIFRLGLSLEKKR